MGIVDHPPVQAFVAEREPTCRTLMTRATIIYGDKKFTNALIQWDTGAEGSCISKKVAEELQPKKRGLKTIQTPSGRDECNVYMLDFELTNGVIVRDVAVMETKIGEQGLDALIGMDIIALGDFAVSNFNGKLVFTFRTPSIKRTDYVAEVKAENIWANTKMHGKGNAKKRHK